jgi:hypothetical protein
MKNRVFSANFSFVLFTVAIALLLILPALLQHGMFMDGTQYAVVSRNFYEGQGTFWFPFLSSSWEKQGQHYFLEHPPLIYALQSLFFKICNGSFLSERLYCFTTSLFSAFFIVSIWKLIFDDGSKYRSLYWFPVLLWVITPSVFWSYTNNMHENTVSVFVLASFYFTLKAYRALSFNYIYIILGGIFIFLATLSKGIPGAFPLITFLIIKIALKDISWKRVIGNTLFLTAVPVLIYFLILFFNENARQSLNFYIHERLLYRINHNGEVDNRLSVLFWLLTDLIVPIGLILALAILFRIKGALKFSGVSEKHLRAYVLLFALIGLSGVVPLAFTHVQRAVYFVPALPFFAIAIALLLVDEMKTWIEQIDAKKIVCVTFAYSMILIVALVISYSIMNYGKTARDEDVLSDVRKIASVTGNNANIVTSKGIYYEWGFQFYLLRYNHITLKTNWEYDQYILLSKEETFSDVNYEKVDLDLYRYALYQKIKGH